MAQLISVKLSRFDGSPWGFRLQGGKDFGTPLVVQKVNGGSPAEAAGLRAGDAVIKVNNTDMFNLRHKEAQDVIVKAGNNFEITVQRGGSTWKPSVSPVTASLPSPQPAAPVSNVAPVTKTSLAAKKQDGPLIGSGHNFSPKPFLNGTGEGPIKSIVNKQYNSPVGIYSEETIAETLSAQAEVLAGGVLGVNFKKNEKNYNAENSEVFKMVQEADKEPKTPEPVEPTAQSGVITPSSPAVSGLRPVTAPETKPAPANSQTSLPPGQNICADCERLIVGVFVRIKEKNLHVECFKCSTCGTSLKNVGYYNINNKLYCDIHAKLVARQNAPAGLAPVTIPTSGKAPAGTISAALANVGAGSPLAPLSPSLNNHSSPLPFTACNPANHNGPRIGTSQPREMAHCTNGTNGALNPAYQTESCNSTINGSKTFRSTLTIQTAGNEVGSTNDRILASKNNITNSRLNSESNRTPKIGEVCEIIFNPVISNELPDGCCTESNELNTYTFHVNQPTRLGTSPVNPPSLRPVQAPTSNNIGGPKPFGGSSIAPPSLSSPPIVNSGSNTLPRPQSQTVTGSGVGGLPGQGSKSGSFAGSSAPKRGRGILNQASGPGSRVPLCAHCNSYVRGPFITALGQIWCPDHFVCVNGQCRRPLQDIGFVEEKGQLYCEYCFEQFIAPPCNKCNNKIKGDCLNAIGKHFHPECFNCSYCGKLFGNSPFFLEEGLPYCESDWNELFTTKCFACGFPVEAGDRWVEALNNNYHSQCFNCTMCKKNLEGQSFYAKGGRPFCKNHAR
ncbi:PDZ and LIM domain protein Zasp isoform X10 [Cephus cinctus]|uniref:PDZ and LIM domain protein Zasp isoform X10 n=1 Tax=Cephus cinctus TaxID=211228 RepID=A0AAJ7BQA5_CEPCN|nr:PDZ and LIM domain protein Zasp isoform X10 [Cephus cinctus]